MVFWFIGALGLVGAAFLLLAIVIGLSVSRGRGAEEKAHPEVLQNSLMLLTSLAARSTRQKRFCTYRRHLQLLFLLWCGLCVIRISGPFPDSATRTASGPTVTKRVRVRTATSSGIGAANGRACRSAGVKFDFHTSAILFEHQEEQKERLARLEQISPEQWTSILARWIVSMVCISNATALWQGGGNLGAYLGLLTSPVECPAQKYMSSRFLVDRETMLDERIMRAIGQFAGQRFLRAQHNAASFILRADGLCVGQFI